MSEPDGTTCNSFWAANKPLILTLLGVLALFLAAILFMATLPDNHPFQHAGDYSFWVLSRR
jgi:hypothetical protein